MVSKEPKTVFYVRLPGCDDEDDPCVRPATAEDITDAMVARLASELLAEGWTPSDRADLLRRRITARLRPALARVLTGGQ